MKNKMEIKWTNEELKKLDEAFIDVCGRTYAEDCEDRAIYVMELRGESDFGKLPKCIGRHAGKYQIQKTTNGKNYTFGTYDTLEKAEVMKKWIFSHKYPERLSSKTLKLSRKEYVPYLCQLKEQEDKKDKLTKELKKQDNVSTTLQSKKNDKPKSKTKSKKTLKSLTLPKSSVNTMVNTHKKYGVKQNEVVQVALNLLDEMPPDELEKYLVKMRVL